MTTTIGYEAKTNTGSGPSWLAGFKTDYESIFVGGWSPYAGIVLLVLVIIGLMISGLFWGVFGGLKLWGDWFNSAIGLGPALDLPETLEGPLLHRMSLMNITLVLGAFCAALLSRQFQVSRPPKLEYIWAALGGCFMGLGATLAGGCTTGGFFLRMVRLDRQCIAQEIRPDRQGNDAGRDRRDSTWLPSLLSGDV